MPGGFGGGGGLGGGGGISGGPAYMSVTDFLAGTIAEDQMIKDLLIQDVTVLTATTPPSSITASVIIANFDGNAAGDGPTAVDLNSLYSSSALDALSALYDQAIADQQASLEAADYSNMFSMEWAAWHSGPTSDILNFINFQQQVIQFSNEQFFATWLQNQNQPAQQMDSHMQQSSLAMDYLGYKAGIIVDANIGMTFRQALDVVAQQTIADPTELNQFARDQAAKLETVVVTPDYFTYGDSPNTYTVSWATSDGGHGVGSNGGPLFPNVDMTQLHAEVLLAKQAIQAHSDYTSKEYVALIYKDASGVLHFTDPQSTGHSDSTTGSFALPDGSVVVAYIHDHPALTGVDEREPSPVNQPDGTHGDWYYVQQLVTSPHVDPALVTYILDNRSGSVYEYGIGQMGDSIHPGDIVG